MNNHLVNRVDFFVMWWLYLLAGMAIGVAMFIIVWFIVAFVRQYLLNI